ncbi:hypothetical protein [Glycomyces xiaoerkulensis]|uniref:hypothetical protein n=1 Tax=Glycomyces xiaoerkulensis TaxID=2038139 RepID=UPI000C25C672|nr:hypothetical protein [Glycomyces xiaoerkulensis]
MNHPSRPYRIGTIIRNHHQIAIQVSWDMFGHKRFDLETQDNLPIGAVTVYKSGRAAPAWDDHAEAIGVVTGKALARGIVRTTQALSAAIDGTVPLDPGHGVRLDPYRQIKVELAEARVAA